LGKCARMRRREKKKKKRKGPCLRPLPVQREGKMEGLFPDGSWASGEGERRATVFFIMGQRKGEKKRPCHHNVPRKNRRKESFVGEVHQGKKRGSPD